ncbi:MAG: AEC family transporter [bacterium]
MSDIFAKILPIILIFILGVYLRKSKFASKEHADFLLKLNFYVALPSLVLLTLSRIKLETNLIFFPIIGVLTILTTFAVISIFANKFKLPKTTLGVFIIGAMIINTGFTLPFLIAGFGDAGLIRKTVFDLGSDTMSYTLMYYLACKYGTGSQDPRLIMKKLALSPVQMSFIIGLILNFTHIPLPAVVVNFLTPLSSFVSPAIMLSLGIYLAPQLKDLKLVMIPLFTRMLLGLFAGIILTSLFGLHGMNQAIGIVLCAAPVGYITLTLSAMENLDKEFAANLISFSILIGLVSTPLLIFLLR